MSRRPRRSAPDRPDLPGPDHLDAAPATLEPRARWDGVRADSELVVPGECADVELRECLLTGVDLSGRRLTGWRGRDVRFERCDLSGAVLDGAVLERVEFTGCRMTGVVLSDSDLRHVLLADCRADLANLRMARADTVVVAGTSLREAELYAARLERTALLDCDLSGADVRDARLSEVDLHGSRLDGVRGALALAGASVGPDQVVALAEALLAAAGVTVTDAPRLSAPDGART